MSMMKLIDDLAPLNRVICSNGYDAAIAYLCDIMPFRRMVYTTDDEHNGWTIPPRWDVKGAKITRGGDLIYDGQCHPLAVMALSANFCGTVDRAELRRHLHYDHRYDDAIPFHFRQQFRSWRRDWGFCVPRTFYDGLEPGNYDVVIDTEEGEGALRMLELTHHGASNATVVFGANLDHPGVANDGLSGVAVGMELFRRLAGRPTKFTYRLVLSQGIIGSEYYLAHQSESERGKLMEGIFLEMLGSDSQLAFQASREGRTNVEHAMQHALDESELSYRKGAFGSIILNDEYVWETYGIPMSSLSRFPYPEYHCSRDDISIVRERNLLQAVDLLERAIEILETSSLITRCFEGTICLSHPRYDLYVDVGQVAFGDVASAKQLRLRQLMDLVPSLNRPVTSRALAEDVGLAEADVLAYLSKWAEKGLLEIR